MLGKIHRGLTWLLNLFDPPPLGSMTRRQKIGRIILVTITLVVCSVLVAMLGALGIYLIERGREFGSTPEFLDGLGIIFVAVVVNVVCVLVLLQIRRADHKLMPPP